MPSVNEFIERARDRRTDFIESIYPIMELHVHNSGNNKHMETLESIGIHKGPALLAIVNSALKLAQTQLDVYGYHVGEYDWVPFNPASNLSISGSTLTVAAHKCVFAGKEFTVKASTINLQTLSSSWNSIMWNLSLRYYPGRGYAVIEPAVTFVPETTHIVHIGTWQSSEGFKVNRHVRMFNFKMDVEDDTSSPPPNPGGGGSEGTDYILPGVDLQWEVVSRPETTHFKELLWEDSEGNLIPVGMEEVLKRDTVYGSPSQSWIRSQTGKTQLTMDGWRADGVSSNYTDVRTIGGAMQVWKVDNFTQKRPLWRRDIWTHDLPYFIEELGIKLIFCRVEGLVDEYIYVHILDTLPSIEAYNEMWNRMRFYYRGGSDGVIREYTKRYNPNNFQGHRGISLSAIVNGGYDQPPVRIDVV